MFQSDECTTRALNNSKLKYKVVLVQTNETNAAKAQIARECRHFSCRQRRVNQFDPARLDKTTQALNPRLPEDLTRTP